MTFIQIFQVFFRLFCAFCFLLSCLTLFHFPGGPSKLHPSLPLFGKVGLQLPDRTGDFLFVVGQPIYFTGDNFEPRKRCSGRSCSPRLQHRSSNFVRADSCTGGPCWTLRAMVHRHTYLRRPTRGCRCCPWAPIGCALRCRSLHAKPPLWTM